MNDFTNLRPRRPAVSISKSDFGPSLKIYWLLALLLWLAGCQSTPAPVTATATLPPTETALAAAAPEEAAPSATPLPASSPTATAMPTLTPTPSPTPTPVSYLGYTYQQANGNRLAAGQGNLPDAVPLDIPLDSVPQWVVGGPLDQNVVWAAVLADGRVQAFEVSGQGELMPLAIEPTQLPPGAPPLLHIYGRQVRLVTAEGTPSPLTHPVLLSDGRVASIQTNGDLMIGSGEEAVTLPVNALPDARLLLDEADRLLLLAEPTDRYPHGVLGDRLEAASLLLIETDPEPQIAMSITIPEPLVIEGLSPIWADVTGDGQREIIVTISSATQGAQIALFSETGRPLGSGPPIGQGNRWRHQLAVAPFAPDGGPELVDVLTPHIGGEVEFYRVTNQALEIVAVQPGYTSHVVRTRNLDLAVAGDFDGDGRPELLLPTQDRTELGAIQRTSEGAEVGWSLPIGSVLSTNLAAVSLPDGRLALAVGRADARLRVWGPDVRN